MLEQRELVVGDGSGDTQTDAFSKSGFRVAEFVLAHFYMYLATPTVLASQCGACSAVRPRAFNPFARHVHANTMPKVDKLLVQRREIGTDKSNSVRITHTPLPGYCCAADLQQEKKKHSDNQDTPT